MAKAKFEIGYDFGITNEQVIIDCIDHLTQGHDTEIVLHHNSGGKAVLAIELSQAILDAKGKVELKAQGYVNSAAAYVFYSVLFWGPQVSIEVTESLCTMYHCPRTEVDSKVVPIFNAATTVHKVYGALYSVLESQCPEAYSGYARAKYDIGHEVVVIFPQMTR
ncbi:hypothetical protein MZJ48_004524 [Vibrio parahaemolyticus]|uniref:hypothetical protein n=1 Tax=Vibrio parahaemolyticus TaxID=670 RepID=UPI0011245A66|nr:hypothetical protein [Vibrio parahaemolyticus]EJC7123246.1 hypothetical protein [Vibrio parahaemolyticus]TOD34851.1 hypothetical protein CGJ65_23990 [Vibrio parahaemolyticus]HAS8533503.1 hypothetical protein [Vibrio vulnificus]